MSGDVFGCRRTGGEYSWPVVGGGQGTSKHAGICTGQPLTTKDYLTQNVNKFEIKKFGFNLKEMSFLVKSIFPSVVASFRR